MTFERIAILSIGEMGYHWARILASRGVEVLTYVKDRGENTRKRAENAGAKSSPSMERLVQDADLIVSIVIPSAAIRVASKVAKAVSKTGRKDLFFLDANAISPMTAAKITSILKPAGVNFIDGCIIGSAAKMDKGAIVYVSGPEASRVQELESFGFSVKVLGPESAQASAFKIVYAGLTKGLQGLFVELLMGARKFGLTDEILQRYEESLPGLLAKVSSSIVGLRVHARRRAEEMDELRRTFNYHGMKSFMAPAVQKVLQSIADLKLDQPSDSGKREGELLATLELFFAQGLLQERQKEIAGTKLPTAELSSQHPNASK
jgi:3-hydroxyisobutyrate dehydrogenase-like beta-hydroxyacid dehydrogenase